MKYFHHFWFIRKLEKRSKNKKNSQIIWLRKENLFLIFSFTNKRSDQTLNEINQDLVSNQKMFRLLQGDVGSGKTIVALIAALWINQDFKLLLWHLQKFYQDSIFLWLKSCLIHQLYRFVIGKSEYKKKRILDDLKHRYNLWYSFNFSKKSWI